MAQVKCIYHTLTNCCWYDHLPIRHVCTIRRGSWTVPSYCTTNLPRKFTSVDFQEVTPPPPHTHTCAHTHTHSHTHSHRLFVEKLPKHPEYSKAVPTDKARIKKLLKQAFPRAMELKEKLKTQFEREKEELEEVIEEEVSGLVCKHI